MSAKVGVKKHVEETLAPTECKTEREKTPTAEVTEKEASQLRAISSSFFWFATHLAPGLTYELSTSESSLNKATVQAFLGANKLYRKAVRIGDRTLYFSNVQLSNLQFISRTDVGWGNRPDDHSQTGIAFPLAEKNVFQGEFGNVSFVERASRAVKRMGRSSLAAEV